MTPKHRPPSFSLFAAPAAAPIMAGLVLALFLVAVPVASAVMAVPGPGPAVGSDEAHALEAVPDPFAEVPLELARELPALASGGPAALGPRPHDYSRRVRASFRVRVRDVVIPYRVLAVTALPGEAVELELAETHPGATPDAFRLRTPEGVVAPVAPGRWVWTAPEEPGPVPIRVESAADGDAIVLNVLVLHPFDAIEGGALNGYRIGEYRPGPGRDAPPAGFVEGSGDVLDLRVAPGFTLGQFLSHQPGDPPYLALSEPLLLKLEALLEEVRMEGIEVETLQLMSAFRTPHYNRAIGNTTDGSRHLWGDAADVYLDLNGWMNPEQARGFYRIAEGVELRGEAHVRPGGLSYYAPNAVRGPFIHVDARGTPARW